MREKKIVRKHVYFSGQVQGVGFRYQAYYQAGLLGLTGNVSNLADGRVEMEVQGEEASVREFLGGLDGRGWIRIDHMEVEDMPLKEHERKFRMLN